MTGAAEGGPALRVLAVADSDSYLKWAAGLLATLPADWDRRVVVVRSPIAPSPAQRTAAVAGLSPAGAPTVTERTLPRLLWETWQERPDVVLLACTGPVVQVVADALSRMGRQRPVLVSGLPGLCLPASDRAWRFRSQVDLLLTHSRRERRGFTEVGRQVGAHGEVALARLPFLDLVRRTDTAPSAAAKESVNGAARLVFAAQAKVPATATDRRSVLLALDRLARERPDLRPVVKLRALAGEQQTHREELPYDVLWQELVAAGQVRDGAVDFATGPMVDQLAQAGGLATVSSTAALEAMAAGLPVLILGNFGLDARMLNVAFAGSGVVGHLGDLASGRLRHPDPDWLHENYFHAREECDWVAAVGRLATLRRTQGLPERPAVVGGPGPRRRRRSRWRLLVPPSLVPLARRAAQLEASSRRMVRRTARA